MSKTYPIHLFKQIVSIQRLSSSVDSSGGVSQTWSSEYASVKASVQPISPRSADQSVQDIQPARFNVFIAGDLQIETTDRVLFDSRTLRITAIKNLSQADRIIRLTAEEVLV